MTPPIITPRNQIVIDIDNLTGQCSIKPKHEIPYPQMMLILSKLMTGYTEQFIQQMSTPSPINPLRNPDQNA